MTGCLILVRLGFNKFDFSFISAQTSSGNSQCFSNTSKLADLLTSVEPLQEMGGEMNGRGRGKWGGRSEQMEKMKRQLGSGRLGRASVHILSLFYSP